jgi:hypothetical protein
MWWFNSTFILSLQQSNDRELLGGDQYFGMYAV